MNFLNRTLTYEDLRDCTLITKNGVKITATIDSIESSRINTPPKFEGHIMGVQTSEPKLSYEDYCRKDFELQRSIYRNMLNSMYGISTAETNYIPEIKNVIFNDPATIVFWDDGTKTVVKCQPGDRFDPEKGLAMAIVKKAYGNKGSYCNKLKKWLPKEEPIDISQVAKSVESYSSDYFSQLKKSILESMTKAFSDSPKPKNRMTFREEEAKKHPENINACCIGGVFGCPRDKEVSKCVIGTDKNCTKCWDREIPDELMDND